MKQNCLISIFYMILLFSLVACAYQPDSHAEVEQIRAEHIEARHKDSHANEHMNETSFEELVQRFNSPERDAYQQPEKVLDYIGDVRGQSILDIGSGTGYFSFKLARRGANVIAGDVDDRFQDYMQNKIDTGSAPSVELRKLPYDSPALDAGEVDKVLIVNTYHHIEDRVIYFGRVLQGLKQNGELIVIDFKKQDGPGPSVEMKMSSSSVVAELKMAGFSSIDMNETLLEHQYILRAN